MPMAPFQNAKNAQGIDAIESFRGKEITGYFGGENQNLGGSIGVERKLKVIVQHQVLV